MQSALVSLALSGLGRDALKVAAALILAVMITIAFTIASLAAILSAPATTLAGRPPAPHAQIPAGSTGSTVVQVARSQLGKPYTWGGASPATSFDCSGLVQWAYRQVGVVLPRTAQQQFDATARLAPDQLQPGDLVFFQICCQPPDAITHVGIYIGSGQMIHAPAPGEAVRVESILTPFWRSHYAGAGRVGR